MKINSIYKHLFIIYLIMVVIDTVQIVYGAYLNSSNNIQVPLSFVFIISVFRWAVWLVFGLILIKARLKGNFQFLKELNLKKVLSLAALIFLGTLSAIIFTNFLAFFSEGAELTLGRFMTNLTHLGVMDSAPFLIAYIILLGILEYYHINVNLIKQYEVSQEMEKDLVRLKSKTNEEDLSCTILNIKSKNGIDRVPVSDIIWIEADDYYVRLHLSRQFYSLRESMNNLEDQLKPANFIRVHRSALVNLNEVTKVSNRGSKGVIVMSNGKSIDVARSKMKALKKAI